MGRFPESPALRLEEPTTDLLKCPGVLLTEELPLRPIQEEGLGDAVEKGVADLARRRLPSVDAPDPLRDLGRPGVPMGLLACDPEGIEEPGADDPTDLLGEPSDLDPVGISRVTEVGGDVMPPEGTGRRRDPPVRPKVAAAPEQVVLVARRLVERRIDRPELIDEHGPCLVARPVAAVGVPVPGHEEVGQVRLLIPGRGVDGQVHAHPVGARLAPEDPGPGFVAGGVRPDKVHLVGLVESGDHRDGGVEQVDTAGKGVAKDPAHPDGDVNPRPSEPGEGNDLDPVEPSFFPDRLHPEKVQELGQLFTVGPHHVRGLPVDGDVLRIFAVLSSVAFEQEVGKHTADAPGGLGGDEAWIDRVEVAAARQDLGPTARDQTGGAGLDVPPVHGRQQGTDLV